MAAAEDRSLRDFRAVYTEHLGFVTHALHRFGTGADLLEDAVQDVFVVAYRRRAARSGTSTKAWLYGIARRVASNYRRSQRRRRTRRSALTQAVGTSRRADALEALHALDRHLGSLRPEDRELLILSEIEGMTGPEIAKARRRNLQTIYSRIRKLRHDMAIGAGLKERVVDTRARTTAHAWAALVPALAPGSAATAAATGATGWIASLTTGWGLATTTAVVAVAGTVALSAPNVAPSAADAGTVAAPPTGDAKDAAPPAAGPEATAPVAKRGSATPPGEPGAVPRQTAQTPSSTSPAVPSTPESEKPARTAAPRPDRPPDRSTPSSDPAPKPTDLATQNEMLTRAAARLRAGAADEALAITNEHARRYPNSAIADLRAALRIDALCQLGKAIQARGEARGFAEKHPDSPFAERVKKSCRTPS